MKVVVDANVLISYLLAKSEDNPFAYSSGMPLKGHFSYCSAKKTIDEFTDSIARKPHLSKNITPRATESLISLLKVIADVSPEPDEPIEIRTLVTKTYSHLSKISISESPDRPSSCLFSNLVQSNSPNRPDSAEPSDAARPS